MKTIKAEDDNQKYQIKDDKKEEIKKDEKTESKVSIIIVFVHELISLKILTIYCCQNTY